MIKIAHVREVQMAKDYPKEVVKVIQEIATILDNEYGENRDVDGGDGGYILIIKEKEELEKLKDIYIDMDDIIPEYVDKIAVVDGEDYTNSLIIMNNDFAVSLIMPLRITPALLKKEMENY